MKQLIILTAACLLIHACQPGVNHALRTAPPSTVPVAVRTSAGAKAIASQVAELWKSSFFRQNKAVWHEISKNDYGLFEKSGPLAGLEKNGLGCFSHTPGRKDVILLRADIFDHFDIEMDGVFERKAIGRKIQTILVHEICHALWANIMDEGEKALFCLEGAEFIEDYQQSKGTEDWFSFLRRAGFDNAASRGGRNFEALDIFIAIHPATSISGAELFAWFGEQAFAAKARIPKRFRKYYRGFLAESGS